MKWLLSLFNNKTKIEESNSEDSYTINMQIYSESEFNGINPYLISILYFPNEIEREKFVLNFNELMVKCGIDNKTSVNEFNRLIGIQEEKDNYLYLTYRRFVEFTFYSVFVKNGVKTRELQKGQTQYNTYEDIVKSWIVSEIVEFNIENKILNNESDLDFEEKLINDNLSFLKDKQNRYNSYKTLAISFDKIGNKLKFEFYLGKIENELTQDDNHIINDDIYRDDTYRLFLIQFLAFSYDRLNDKLKFDYYLIKIENEYKKYNISEKMIGKVFREIGELFLTKNDIKNCLKWFELGIEIYPKLGVKRKINELKSL